MSSFEHHATVDKGLKMKIKCKNVNVEKTEKQKKELGSKLSDSLAGEGKSGEISTQSANGMLTEKSGKISLSDKEKSPKSKSSINKKDKTKGAKVDTTVHSSASFNGVENIFSGASSSMEPKLGEIASGKKDCVPDPYEFNAKVEDDITMPIKKMKVEKEKVNSLCFLYP